VSKPPVDVATLREKIARSRKRREELIDRLGFVPESVLMVPRGKLTEAMFSYQKEDPKRRTGKDLGSPEARAVAAAAGASFVKVKSGGGTHSVMPAEVVDFFVKFYAAPGQVYLDPFAGQGVQLQVAHRNGLAYYGMDLSRIHADYIRGVVARLGNPDMHFREGDSRDPSWIPDGIGDFSFHSPPYWDVEVYGDEPGQLGAPTVSYEDFLTGLRDVARAWLPKHKPGAYHIVNVNDFRKDGRFYPFHSDVTRIWVEAGWVAHDIWILAPSVAGAGAKGGSGGMSFAGRLFAVARAERKLAPKVHEYAMVFRSPG
jgi:hypothetical protein